MRCLKFHVSNHGLLDTLFYLTHNCGAEFSSTAIFMETLEGGDAEAGRIVAGTHLAAQCIRCHRFGREDGSEIGPNLGSIAREKDRDYLLRSLVDPGADIAEGYGVSTITLKSGSSISGQLGKETKKGIDLILADGSTQKIAAVDVASKTDPISSMPPMGYLLTKRELRDVVAYLASLE